MNPGISALSFVLLQGVFRRAGGLIYVFLLLSCGIRLLMFQPCLDRILICLIRSLIYYSCNKRPSHNILFNRSIVHTIRLHVSEVPFSGMVSVHTMCRARVPTVQFVFKHGTEDALKSNKYHVDLYSSI